jgi:hypothetical protein
MTCKEKCRQGRGCPDEISCRLKPFRHPWENEEQSDWQAFREMPMAYQVLFVLCFVACIALGVLMAVGL